MTDATSVTVVDTRKHPRYKVAIPVDCSTRELFVSNHVCKGSIRATGRVIWNYDIERGTWLASARRSARGPRRTRETSGVRPYSGMRISTRLPTESTVLVLRRQAHN